MTRMVQCAKLGRELPGLEKPPFPGAFGQKIYDSISAEAYAEWKPQLTILINHYGLNPADPEARQILRQQQEQFFFGAPQQQGEQNLVPEDVRQG